MTTKKIKRGRPRVVDVIQYLRDHPELRDQSISNIARAMGTNNGTVLCQLASAIIDKQIYIRSIVEFSKSKHVLGNQQYLNHSSDQLITQSQRIRAHVDRYVSDLSTDERRAKQREYRQRWLATNPDAPVIQKENNRKSLERIKQDPERYAKLLDRMREYERNRRGRKQPSIGSTGEHGKTKRSSK